MSQDILFDNVIITEEWAIADKWAADTFDKKRLKISKDSVSTRYYMILFVCQYFMDFLINSLQILSCEYYFFGLVLNLIVLTT